MYSSIFYGFYVRELIDDDDDDNDDDDDFPITMFMVAMKLKNYNCEKSCRPSQT